MPSVRLSAVLGETVDVDAEADARLAGEVQGVLAVALRLRHRLGDRGFPFVEDGRRSADGDVMQVVGLVVDDERHAWIPTQVGHPVAIAVTVDPEVVGAEQVVDDDLPWGAVAADRRQHRAPRLLEEASDRLDEVMAARHAPRVPSHFMQSEGRSRG